MFSIWMRSIGKALPNARRHWHGSNNSLDCHCAKKGQGDEKLSHSVLAGTAWKHRVRCGPRWTVVALSRCEAEGGCGNNAIESPRTRIDRRFGFHTACIDG